MTHPLRIATAVLIGFLFAGPVSGQARQNVARVLRALPGGGGAGGGNISLPYTASDASGNQWSIYPGGWCQIQGNQSLYSQGAMIQINGMPANPNARANSARVDDKTGEVVFENLQAGGFGVTRRVFVDKENSYVRYVDVIRNMQGQDATVNVQVSTNLNFGIDAAETIPDPRRKGNPIAWTTSNNNGRAVLEIYAGKGTKLSPSINFQQGNSNVLGQIPVLIPAGKEAAVMHIHAVVNSTEQAAQFVAQLRESKVLNTLPPELRKSVVNFVSSQSLVGERELLRGEVFDVVEIRGGGGGGSAGADQVRGTLKDSSYKLNAFYGNVEVPADRVLGIFNVGDFRPRQLIVTTDGEILGGTLAKPTIDLELSSGQVTPIPLSQISRVGYRKRAGEPEEMTFDKAFVSLRTGERVAVERPTEPIDVLTRYGPLKLAPEAVAAIVFQSEEHGVHEVLLTDGSRFAGLAASPEFQMKLAGGGGATTQPSQVVRFPASSIARIQFAKPAEDVDPSQSPTLRLANEDLLIGSLAGQIKLDTAFDTLAVDASQVKQLTRTADDDARAGASPGDSSPLDVQVTLWDSSVVGGQLQAPSLTCQLASGVAMQIPVALIEEYSQPQPAPAAGTIDRIKASVAQLNADDWKTRDRAEAELTAMGDVVAGTLKQLRAAQPPEAQQRIDEILAAVAKKKP